jgi:uncharacterized protein (TIGR00255 family)
MICSMTAFARYEHIVNGNTFVWEIRSVNQRYLEPVFRVPDNYREIELPLRDILRKHLQRGKVECSLRIQYDKGSQTLAINSDIIAQLKKASDDINAQLSNIAPLSVADILKYPGVVVEEETDKQALHAQVIAAFESAVKQLIQNREREGAAIKQFINDRLNELSEQAARVKSELPTLLELQRKRIVDRLTELNAEYDSNRLEQELVFLAQRADVAEELNRLETHVTEVSRNLDKGDAVGRRLDFLMQELNREANTLSSKSLSTTTTQCAVEMNPLIEQMREQVQNIE